MTLVNESAYLPSSPSDLPKGDWLILAPHPDDESFGMGGTLLLAQLLKIRVDIIFVTDGHAADLSNQNLVAIREQEATLACEKLGIRTVLFWREKDRKLSASQHLIKRLSEVMIKNNYASIFFPSPQEPHPDHRVTAVLAWEGLRHSHFCAEGFSYEISVQGYTNQLIDISTVAVKKQALMEIYDSQLTHNHYVDRILGLNQSRAWSLPLSVTHAEAFYRWNKDDKPLNALLLSMAHQLSSLTALPNKRPLVSVMTRTQHHRPEFLREAIRSVAGQNYPSIELVVINDGGENCQTLVTEEAIGSIQQFHYKQLEQPSGRAVAANAGLQLCTGDYIIFLDDDDWFHANHIDKLVTTLIAHPKVSVAYTGVQCMDENKQCRPEFFAVPFNATRLITENFIPIHAALFSRSLLEQGCRIDESLVVYEDWDFWIQASMFSQFMFVEGMSAYYRISNESGFGIHPNMDIANNSSQIIFNKWLPKLAKEQLLHLMARARVYDPHQEKLAEQTLKISQLNEEINRQHKDDQIQQQLLATYQDQEHSLSECQHTIQKQQQLLAERDQQIYQQNLTLHQHLDKVQTHYQVLSQQNKQIHTLNQLLAERNQQVQNLHQNFTEQLSLKDHYIDDIKYSTSWLLTKPLRKCKDLLNHFLAKEIAFPLTSPSTDSQPQPDDIIVNRHDYSQWVLQFDTLDELQRRQINAKIETFESYPLISVIMPSYEAPLDFLEAAIISIKNQLYPHWELCIADDASKNPDIIHLLQSHAQKDPRIKVIFRQENGHISIASNSALTLATGDFIALMDHDDLLPEHALFWVAQTIQDSPNVALMYSDEDKLTEDNAQRINPYFKSDWNPELFLGHNLISHLGVYKTDIVREIGGFRQGFEGSQDYDLALRFIEKIESHQIIHIPKILYHWRILAGSTAKTIDSKPYAAIAAEKAVNQHFERCQIHASVKAFSYGHRLAYTLPAQLPLVSIIIPTRNAVNYVKTCIKSIYTLSTYANFEILLLDNGSDEAESIRYFAQLEQEHENFKIIRDNRAFNYSAQNNLAVTHANGEFIALLNNDIEVISPHWLEEMVSLALQPDVGAVGAKLLYPNNQIQHAGVILGLGGCAGHAHHQLATTAPGYFGRAALVQSFSAVTAACLVVSREKFLEVNGLNEKYLTVAFNDIDFCLKLKRAGYRNLYTPFAELYHYESATRGQDNTPQKQQRFTKEVAYMQNHWQEIMDNDPAYNVNLTLSHSDFSFAYPPRGEHLP